MSKPVVLQMGAYPEWDEVPLNADYDLRRYFEAADKDAGRWNRAVRWLSVRAGIGGHRLETIETGRLLGVFKRECGYAKRTLDGEQVI